MEMILEQLNPYSCKTYLLGIKGKRSITLIDPVLEHVNDYIALINEHGYHLTHVIDTHSHADHISGAASLKDITGCDYIMHTDAPTICATFRVSDGFRWNVFDTVPVEVMYTPGHTKDSISLIFPGSIFTGDTLFLDEGGAGRDDLPGGNPEQHWESLKKIAGLSEELIVYPAHDYRNRKPSSLKQQKGTNPYLRPMTKEEFIKYIEDLKLGPAEWMENVLKANYACARYPGANWIPLDAPACEVKGTLEMGVNEIQVSLIPPSVLMQKLLSESPPLLIDVREARELSGELGHIRGIVHIPIGALTHHLEELEKYRNTEIVTVCRSGARAHTAAQILKKAGFSKVSVLTGGMIQWNAS
jgi:sulfur dioxygenase